MPKLDDVLNMTAPEVVDFFANVGLPVDQQYHSYDLMKEPTTDELPAMLEKHALRLAGLGHYDIAADVQLAAERLSPILAPPELQEVLDNIVESGLLSEEQYDVLAAAIRQPSSEDSRNMLVSGRDK